MVEAGQNSELQRLQEENDRLQVENQRLAADNERLSQQLAELRSRRLGLQEETRRRLARDLHDGPAQALSTLAMNVDVVCKLLEREPAKAALELEAFRALAVKASGELRDLLFELRPLILESQGLLPALQSYVARLNNAGGPRMELRLQEGLGSLQRAAESIVFAIIQEAISNVRKHARASNCRIALSQQEGYLQVAISDDGRGFDLPETRRHYDQHGSLGLLTMSERAELLGGSLTVTSGPGQGTVVILRVPAPVSDRNGRTAHLAWALESGRATA